MNKHLHAPTALSITNRNAIASLFVCTKDIKVCKNGRNYFVIWDFFANFVPILHKSACTRHSSSKKKNTHYII